MESPVGKDTSTHTDRSADYSYASLWLKQNGVCAICGNPEPVPGRKLSIDHDHTTGSIRGLLCSECNFALGQFHDDRERLFWALEYLECGGVTEQYVKAGGILGKSCQNAGKTAQNTAKSDSDTVPSEQSEQQNMFVTAQASQVADA